MSIRGNDSYCQNFVELCSTTSDDSTDLLSFKDSFICGVLMLTQHSILNPDSLRHWTTIFAHIRKTSCFSEWNDACKAFRAELLQLRMPPKSLYETWIFSKLWIGIKHTYPNLQLDPRDPQYVACLQFLGWFNRLPIDLPDPSLEYEDYLRRDLELETFHYDRSLTHSLRAIAHEWFSTFTITETFRPRLSTGSTADSGRDLAKKYDNLGLPRFHRYFTSQSGEELWVSTNHLESQLVAEVKSVPKQMGKNRLICMEPATLVAHQLGILDSFNKWLKPSHPLRCYLHLEDQEKNRNLVRNAQKYDLATIDLSNASDSVSWELVRSIFHGLPLLKYLWLSRSKTCYIGAEIHRQRKFAPMGSGVCFLIESIVFALILELVRRNRSCFSSAPSIYWSVYGDDLIVPTQAYTDVIDVLEMLGFTVNKTKSYSTGPYRESCGVECVNDVEIPIIRHPRRHLFSSVHDLYDTYHGYRDLVNSFSHSSYRNARRYLLKKFSEMRFSYSITRILDAVSVLDMLLKDKEALVGDDTTVKCRYSRRYQRYEYRTYIIKPHRLNDTKVSYFVWLLTYSRQASRYERLRLHNGYTSWNRGIRDLSIDRRLSLVNGRKRSAITTAWTLA